MEYTEHDDFISDFDFDANSKTLVASSGQGTISIYDIRKSKMVAMSANQDDELLSICIVKDRRKVVVGSQEGVLNIYSWGDWGDCTDRFIGHPNSIDTICKIDEDTVATGSSDGIIRYEAPSTPMKFPPTELILFFFFLADIFFFSFCNHLVSLKFCQTSSKELLESTMTSLSR